MNWIDWAVLVIAAMSAVAGWSRGLLRSVIGLVGAIVAFVAAAWYAPVLAPRLQAFIPSFTAAEAAAFVLILVALLLGAAGFGRLARKTSEAVGLGLVDRLGGAIFGVARSFLLLIALLAPFSTVMINWAPARDSFTLPYMLAAAHEISFVLPSDTRERIAKAFHTATQGTRQ